MTVISSLMKRFVPAALCAAAAVAIADGHAYAQISFGKMREAQKQGASAPELEDDETEKALSIKPDAPKKTTAKTESEKKSADGKTPASATKGQTAVKENQPADEPEEGADETEKDADVQDPKEAAAPAPAGTSKRPVPRATARSRNAAAAKKPAANSANDDADSEEAPDPAKRGPILGAPVKHRYRAGMICEARPGGTCTDVLGTAPVPMDFPEQKVRTLEEDFPRVAKVDYRDLKEGGARQLVFKMRELRPGAQVEASATFEVVRYPILPPAQPEIYLVPKTVPTNIRRYLKEGKYMQSNAKNIRSLAKETTKDCETAWEKVDAILAFVRDNIQYKEVLIEKPMRGALAALRAREGDCEDMSALFIAMCRASDIPARLVRVPGHCWAEFYLVDDEKNGYWFPAQVAGMDKLGAMQDLRVILQKGDAFRLPESPKDEDLYVKELFTGKVKENGPDPIHQFIQETDGK